MGVKRAEGRGIGQRERGREMQLFESKMSNRHIASTKKIKKIGRMDSVWDELIHTQRVMNK